MQLQTIILLIVVGLSAGVLSGLVGVGGGIIIVPSLVFFLGYSQKEAQGTSLAILLLPIGILAVSQYYKQGYIKVNSAAIVAVAFVAGSFLGSKISLAMENEKLKKFFGIVLMLLSIQILFFDKHKDEERTDNIKPAENKHG